jgi:hypothetical protein
LHITNSVLHLPLSEFRTRTWFILRVNSDRLPTRLVQSIVRLQGPHVAKQDKAVLEQQTATVRRFGGEHYSSTDLDLFGNAIALLVRHAANGDAASAAPTIEPREVTFTA